MAKTNNTKDNFLETAAKEKTLIAEKHVSYIRAIVILFGTITFLMMDKTYVITKLAYPLLIPIWIYGVWIVVFKSYKTYPIMRAAWFTLISDSVFATIWIYATGGFHSPFYIMFYTSIIAAAFRFSMKITLITSAIYTACYFLLMLYMDQLSGNEVDVVIRTGYTFIIGYFASLIIIETNEQVKAKKMALSFKEELEKLVDQRTEELENSLEQVNTLLKEVHHRVKNNLQIISSLLNLQSNEETNPEVREALIKSRNRILSIALIHQNLYGSKTLSSIKAVDFTKQLVDNIKGTIARDSSKILIVFDIEDDLYFNMDTMTPLGLMINELLTNSYKYAFKKSETGNIKIAMKKLETDHYIMEYSDDGPGLPQNINFQTSETLGLGLIKILSEQLNGKVEYFRDPINKFKVEFYKIGNDESIPKIINQQ